MHHINNFNFALLDRINHFNYELIAQRHKIDSLQNKIQQLHLSHLPRIQPNIPQTARADRRLAGRRSERRLRQESSKRSLARASSFFSKHNFEKKSRNNSVFVDSGRKILRRLSKFEKRINGALNELSFRRNRREPPVRAPFVQQRPPVSGLYGVNAAYQAPYMMQYPSGMRKEQGARGKREEDERGPSPGGEQKRKKRENESRDKSRKWEKKRRSKRGEKDRERRRKRKKRDKKSKRDENGKENDSKTTARETRSKQVSSKATAKDPASANQMTFRRKSKRKSGAQTRSPKAEGKAKPDARNWVKKQSNKTSIDDVSNQNRVLENSLLRINAKGRKKSTERIPIYTRESQMSRQSRKPGVKKAQTGDLIMRSPNPTFKPKSPKDANAESEPVFSKKQISKESSKSISHKKSDSAPNPARLSSKNQSASRHSKKTKWSIKDSNRGSSGSSQFESNASSKAGSKRTKTTLRSSRNDPGASSTMTGDQTGPSYDLVSHQHSLHTVIKTRNEESENKDLSQSMLISRNAKEEEYRNLLRPRLIDDSKPSLNIFQKKQVVLKRTSRVFQRLSKKLSSTKNRATPSQNIMRFRKLVNAIIFLRRYGIKDRVGL